MITLNPNVLGKIAGTLAIATLFVLALSLSASAQRRDFMTDAEIEIVRENQDIDMRVDVLTKMIDRRFAALKIDVGGWKPPAKQSETWGDEPAGTRLQLFTDIKRLLQKAVDDIDDVSEHDANALTQNKTTGKLFPKAVRSLSAAASRYSPAFKAAVKSADSKSEDDEKARGTILDSIDLCDQIIEAAAKLPAELKEKKKS